MVRIIVKEYISGTYYKIIEQITLFVFLYLVPDITLYSLNVEIKRSMGRINTCLPGISGNVSQRVDMKAERFC